MMARGQPGGDPGMSVLFMAESTDASKENICRKVKSGRGVLRSRETPMSLSQGCWQDGTSPQLSGGMLRGRRLWQP